MISIKDQLGGTFIFDDERLLNSVGGHALRVTPDGELQVLLMNPDMKGWEDISECDLVQVTGRPARKN